MGDYNIFHHMPWSGAYAIYFFTIGIAAALFFFAAKSWFPSGKVFEPIRLPAVYTALALLAFSGVLLIEDLSQPLRFLNMLNPAYLSFSSPLAWGGLNLMLFGAVLVLFILAVRKNDEANAKRLGVIGTVLAVCLPIYTGYDLAAHQARPVWNTPLMPVLFVALSLLSGAAVATFMAKGKAEILDKLRLYMLWSGGAVVAMLVGLLGTTSYGGAAQELTFMFMTTGTLGTVFVGLGLLLGTAAPLALLLTSSGQRQQTIVIAALLLLVGGMALRYSILISGQIVQTYF